MLGAFSKQVLNRRPKIERITPRSKKTIPNPSPSVAPTPAETRIDNLINSFDNINIAAEKIESKLAERAKDVVLELDFTNPEDFATAQAAARCFPDQAEEIAPGVSVIKSVSFSMYMSCMGKLKDHGKAIGQQNQLPAATPDPRRTQFGGVGEDRRPELNAMASIVPPVDIPAYVIAAIPILFLMLKPLEDANITAKIIGHNHADPATGFVGPGVPVPLPF